jgi:hypothetical protein
MTKCYIEKHLYCASSFSITSSITDLLDYCPYQERLALPALSSSFTSSIIDLLGSCPHHEVQLVDLPLHYL